MQARAELDKAKRREMYVEMQRIVHNEGGICLRLFLADSMAHSDNLVVPEVIGYNWDLDGVKRVPTAMVVRVMAAGRSASIDVDRPD